MGSFNYDQLARDIMVEVRDSPPQTIASLVTATSAAQEDIEDRVRELVMKGVLNAHTPGDGSGPVQLVPGLGL